MVAALERHYTIAEVAAMWKLSRTYVRSLFQDRPGVMRLGSSGRRAKRDYVTLRIPESVMLAAHRERCR